MRITLDSDPVQCEDLRHLHLSYSHFSPQAFKQLMHLRPSLLLQLVVTVTLRTHTHKHTGNKLYIHSLKFIDTSVKLCLTIKCLFQVGSVLVISLCLFQLVDILH